MRHRCPHRAIEHVAIVTVFLGLITARVNCTAVRQLYLLCWLGPPRDGLLIDNLFLSVAPDVRSTQPTLPRRAGTPCTAGTPCRHKNKTCLRDSDNVYT